MPPQRTLKHKVTAESPTSQSQLQSASTTDKVKKTVKAKGKRKSSLPTGEYNWRPEVDYSTLSAKEKQSRSYMDLFTIFALAEAEEDSACLTVEEIHEAAEKLGMSDLAGITIPTLRNTIQRWNDLVVSEWNGGKRCDVIGCKRPAAWGFWAEDPIVCEAHRHDDAIPLVEGRLVRVMEEDHRGYRLTASSIIRTSKEFDKGLDDELCRILQSLTDETAGNNDEPSAESLDVPVQGLVDSL